MAKHVGDTTGVVIAPSDVAGRTALHRLEFLTIDSSSLESLVINREIFIPNREIGRFSLFYQKSGDLPPNRETWKLFYRLGRED